MTGPATGVLAPPRAGPLFAYGALRAPLALLELPLFVLLPAFYGRDAGLPLAVVGAVLFAARAFDAIADPLMGAWIDRSRGRLGYRGWILAALLPLALGFVALLHPPQSLSPGLLAAWLALLSLLTYLAWSAITIAHQAWGAELGHDPATRVRITGWREACGLAGVLASSLLLEPARASGLSALFLAALLGATILLMRAPLPSAQSAAPPTSPSWLTSVREPWALLAHDRRFRSLLAAFMLNGTASAIPATLVLFFVADVLGVPGETGLFLLLYFVAAALGMPGWVALGARIGPRTAWLLGMLAAIGAFAWAFGLGQGDTLAFAVICVLTGLALGADLAMPSALLAGVIAASGSHGSREGSYFGMWALATKLNLAAAAGLGLPLLALLGYQPGSATSGVSAAASSAANTEALSIAYALVPCLFKLAAAALVWRSADPDPQKEQHP